MDIEAVKEAYPFVEIISIGKSVLGKDLTVLKIGNGPKEVFYNAAIHRKRMDNRTYFNGIYCRILLGFK